MAGQVFLSGEVASEEDRRLIEDEARNTPGVSRVISDLRVAAQRVDVRDASSASSAGAPPDLRERPKLPPRGGAAADPARPEAAAPRPEPAPQARVGRSGHGPRHTEADEASRRSPGATSPLAGLPIAVQSRGDVVTLTGKVPSVYEAMLAYRTVEQTPGVRDLVDQLQFQVPDENHPNPLRQKGRPEDLEPYLTSQIRRHVGDLAHVDRVRVRGDVVEVRGTLLDAHDQNGSWPSSARCLCSETSASNPCSSASDRASFSTATLDVRARLLVRSPSFPG